MASQKKDNISIYFAGHFSIDTIIRDGEENAPTLGGSVAYGSLALKTYTPYADIKIISNLGGQDFDKSLLDILKDKNIDLTGLRWFDTKNTNFVLDYLGSSRTLTLRSRSFDLISWDVPRTFLDPAPCAIVLAPLCNEIPVNYVRQVLDYFPDSCVGIDLQGFIRKISDDGLVSLARDEENIANINKIIKLGGERLILKGSEEEMKTFSGKEGLEEVMDSFCGFDGLFVMTLGEEGSMISRKGKNTLKIPAFLPRRVVDETGAGDAYLSIFLYEFVRSGGCWEDVKNAGYLASAAASFLVEGKGLRGFETKEKVLERVSGKNYVQHKNF